MLPPWKQSLGSGPRGESRVAESRAQWSSGRTTRPGSAGSNPRPRAVRERGRHRIRLGPVHLAVVARRTRLAATGHRPRWPLARRQTAVAAREHRPGRPRGVTAVTVRAPLADITE